MTPGPQDRATVVTATIVQVFKRSLLAWFDHGDANVTAARRELEAILRDESLKLRARPSTKFVVKTSEPPASLPAWTATAKELQMAKRDDVFPSKYWKAADLNGKPLTVTIVSAPLETLKNPEGKEQSKTVLHFRGMKKMFPLNITNWDSVADIAGDDTNDWPGCQVELYPAKTEMKGKTVDCIRVRAPGQAELPKAKAAAATKRRPIKKPDDDMDDEIPFN